MTVSKMKPQSLKFVIGGLLIVGIVVWIFGSISSENLTYYYQPSEIPAKYDTIKGSTVRIMGVVSKDSVHWIPRETKLTFQLTDDQKHFVDVQYIGAKPDMFREGQGIVVEGVLDDPSMFVADNLLVKHSEEYTVTEHTQNKEDYYKSLSE